MKKHFTGKLAALMLILSLFWPGLVVALETTNDPFFGQLWYLNQIQAPQAWDTTFGFEGVIVAVIDSGVDITHPDLKDNIWRNQKEIPDNKIDDDKNGFIDDVNGWNFVGKNNDPRPDTSSSGPALFANHGTIAAGIIAARGDNGAGIVGITWQTTIMPLRALDQNGSGDPLVVARAVDYAVANGAKVINLSFVSTKYDYKLDVAVRHAYESGVVVVAAAGNAFEAKSPFDFANKMIYPACFDRSAAGQVKQNYVIGVAATNENDKKAAFSNYGKNCVDISAPGVRILALQTYVGGSQKFNEPYGGYYQGTSIAAPIISGVAALIFSIRSDLSPEQILLALQISANPVDTTGLPPGSLGAGRVNAFRALRIALAIPKKVSSTVAPKTRDLLPSTMSPRLIVTAPGANHAPVINLFSEDGVYVRGFLPFDKSFRGGVNIAGMKVGNNLGANTIVVAEAGAGTGRIRIYDIDGFFLREISAYGPKFRGGISIATGDFDGDSRDDIVVAPSTRGEARIRIYSAEGILISEFFAFSGAKVAGVSIFAVPNLNGFGSTILVVPNNFTKSGSVTSGKKSERFLIDGRLLGVGGAIPSTIISGSRLGGLPLVSFQKQIGRQSIQFYAYEPTYRGGVNAIILDDRESL